MAKSILVVDDSSIARKQLRTFLEQQGFKVSEANNGAAGLDTAKGNPYDLLIVDVNMPVMDGIQMISEVRKLPAYKRTPIFVLTTESADRLALKGKVAGATAWIVKPFNPTVLRKGIKKVLNV